MSAAKIFPIKESVSQLKKLRRESIPMIAKRIDALLIFKANEKEGISKRSVAQMLRVDQNSVQTWRTLYIKGGIEKITNHAKVGFKPSVFTEEQQEAMRLQMHKVDNGFVGFVEFLDWFNTTFSTDVNYKTFHGFVVRKFKAKIKTARKVHVKKDKEAVENFKKNSPNCVKKSTTKKVRGLKK
jgi:transposase